jgi:hypothetical protein
LPLWLQTKIPKRITLSNTTFQSYPLDVPNMLHLYIITFLTHPKAFPIDVWIQCCPQKLLKDGHKWKFVPINDAQFSITFTSSFWRFHKVLSIMPLFIWSWVLATNVWNIICSGVLPSSLYLLPKSALPNYEVHVSISPFGNFA